VSEFTKSSRYQQCQALFDRAYPGFRNAGDRYQDLVASLVTHQTSLLELGCGRASLAEDPIRRAGRSAGIDLSLSDLRCNQTVACPAMADGAHLPFPAASFDLLISQWVIEHLEEPIRVFREMARVLRPGGRMVHFTTNALNYVPLISRLIPETVQEGLLGRLLKRPAHESFPTYFRANTHRRIAQLASQSGLVLDDYAYVGNPFYLAFSPLLFRGGLLFEKLTDRPPLRRFKLYLLVTLHKA